MRLLLHERSFDELLTHCSENGIRDTDQRGESRTLILAAPDELRLERVFRGADWHGNGTGRQVAGN